MNVMSTSLTSSSSTKLRWPLAQGTKLRFLNNERLLELQGYGGIGGSNYSNNKYVICIIDEYFRVLAYKEIITPNANSSNNGIVIMNKECTAYQLIRGEANRDNTMMDYFNININYTNNTITTTQDTSKTQNVYIPNKLKSNTYANAYYQTLTMDKDKTCGLILYRI